MKTLSLLLVLFFSYSVAAQEKELAFDRIDKKVASLKKPDVAWRMIDWKTCLIEGLNESKEQNKPILLWVFIDRPIDDERC